MQRTLGRYGFMMVMVAAVSIASSPGFAAKTHTMKKGDTLWQLAQRFYGDPTIYPVFLEVNQISNPRTIQTGKVITVPNIDDMKNIAKESDPAKRQALISAARSGSPSSPSNKTSSGSYSARSMEKILEGPVDAGAIKTVSTEKKSSQTGVKVP